MEYSQNYEPMDVDLSAQSNNAMDISYENIEDSVYIKKEKDVTETSPTPNISITTTEFNSAPQVTIIKKYHIKLQKENNIKSPLNKTFLNVFVIFIISSILTAILMNNIQCIDDLHLGVLQKNLSHQIFGQSQAINEFIEALNAVESHKIVFLYGSTGVGKTYTSSILLEQTKDYLNVNHYTMPSFGDIFTSSILFDLYLCRQSFIIVDDLSLHDKNIDTLINNVVTKSRYLERNLTVLLIYNCENSGEGIKCDETFTKQLKEQFKSVNAFKMFIKFEILNEEHLRKCMESELKTDITDSEFEKLVKDFDVTADGCKGVHTKMKLRDSSQL